MSDEKHTRGANPAPGGVTSGDDTTEGVDSASAASISGPAVHPGRDIVGNPEPAEDTTLPADDTTLPARPENEVLRSLAEAFDDAVWTVSAGQDVVRLPAGRFAEFGQAAKDAGFEVCVDVTAIDWYRSRRIRFDVVANLLSHQHVLRLRMVAAVPGDDPTIPSLTPIWPAASFAERETYDMFGITFEGHPDLTRILMPDDWVGFPLRKDFSVGSVPVQFKESHKVT